MDLAWTVAHLHPREWSPRRQDDVLEFDVPVRDSELVVEVLEGLEELVEDPLGCPAGARARLARDAREASGSSGPSGASRRVRVMR